MAPLEKYYRRKVLFLYLFLIFITSSFISAAHSPHQPQSHHLFGTTTRTLLELQDENTAQINHKKTSVKTKTPTKNQTKLIKPSSTPSKNQTKLIKPSSTPSKNQTKLIKTSNFIKNQTQITKPPSNSSKNKTKNIIKTSSFSLNDSSPLTSIKSHLRKLNSTSNKPLLPKKSSSNPPKLNKTTNSKKQIDQEDEDDLVSEFRDLPSKFQETFLPDMARISETSKVYLTRYNKEFTKGFKPYVGNKYASTMASILSLAFIVLPLILVSLIFSRIKAYFSLQKLLIFIQIYLAIYFTILCLSSLITGLEPLKFFYTTSHSTYVCVQVLQTLAYVLYLLLLLMYLVLVFSTETGLATKLLGLAQTFVGFAVGLHYYIAVFHRAVLHQPPKASWKAHALYATCFFVICLLGKADRGKKAYLEEGGEEGKRS